MTDVEKFLEGVDEIGQVTVKNDGKIEISGWSLRHADFEKLRVGALTWAIQRLTTSLEEPTHPLRTLEISLRD